ncbi:MAG: response regulator [Candidatus Omnitrophica bacterium]|nr:response regulator [Candidatus Omnitrophota bacterium]MBL7210454.1 response regulator [Candidatus Omnitrophota bacterium]
MKAKSILIIDDEVELLDLLKIRLQDAGYEVYTAPDGKEGLEKARAQRPDLIVLDILMPNKDGYAFVKESRRDKSINGIPIIILTAKAAMQDLFKMQGVSDYIMKPFEARELMQRIEKLLNKPVKQS